jgi:hypothetical protein
MTKLKIRMRPRTYITAALMVTAILVAGMVVAGANTFWADDYQAGQTTASQSSEDDTIVASAGGESITLQELRDGVMHLQQMKDSAERELQGLGMNPDTPTDYLEDRHNLVIEWGDENVALASLIEERILHQKAIELGYEATEEEISESAGYAREAYENGELDPYTQGYIDSIGADTYFNEVYPVLAARSLSVKNLHNGLAQEKGLQEYADVRTHWHDFEEKTIGDADVAIPESDDHSATLDYVMGFLHEVRETNRRHISKLHNIPAAPDESWVAHVKREADGSIEVLHHNLSLDLCSETDAAGVESHSICDADGEALIDLLDGDIFVITPPGEPLPVFPEDEEE